MPMGLHLQQRLTGVPRLPREEIIAAHLRPFGGPYSVSLRENTTTLMFHSCMPFNMSKPVMQTAGHRRQGRTATLYRAGREEQQD